MSSTTMPDPVIAGVRAYMQPDSSGNGTPPAGRRKAPEGFPELVLLLDTETTTDPTQRLRFGSYRLCQWQADAEDAWALVCLEEGLFYADDLPTRAPRDFNQLRDYVLRESADVPGSPGARLALYSRAEFVDRILWKAGMVGRALVVGFNLPFDLSRLAVGWSDARGRGRRQRFVKGFSFVIWVTQDPKTGTWTPNTVRPRLRIKHHDSHSAEIQCTSSNAPELQRGRGRQRRSYQGQFLDLKTFAFALTGTKHSLQSLAVALHTRHQKSAGAHDGPLTPDYITYNRQDVRVTQECLQALRAEFERHPIAVEPWQLRSPASLIKGYLRAMGITPPAARTPTLPESVYGIAMAAYYGGRSEMHIARVPVPVVYTDVTSMYPTVQALGAFREWLTAESFVWEECTAQAQAALDGVTLNTSLKKDSWPRLRFFGCVRPDDDILPLRAQYHPHNDGYGIAVTRVSANRALWYSGFDLAASALLTGKAPRLEEAFILRPIGRITPLRSVTIRNQVKINPSRGDVFQTLVEMRHHVKGDLRLSQSERDTLSGVLKTLANSGSYGIFAEINPQDLAEDKTMTVAVHGAEESFQAKSHKPEEPGEFCFPPLAASITAAARFLLAIIEQLTREKGGTYALCDTDSMAVVASETGGFWPCPGGNHRGPQGTTGILALSWRDVQAIAVRLESLNPYGEAIHGTLLKIEDENFKDGRQIQLYAFGLSAKRYCLFHKGIKGAIEIVKASEHGLGHLLNPTDPEDQEKGLSGAARWIEDVWRNLVAQALGGQMTPPPAWFVRPAVARHRYSSPALLRPQQRAAGAMAYCNQVKPFNFGLTCYVAFNGAPAGTDVATCHLVGPYERDPRKWETQPWTDTASGVVCGITTGQPTSDRIARVKSVADIVAAYAAHAEAKSAGPNGKSADASAIGVLSRRHVTPAYCYHLGKETNQLEEVRQGQVRDLAQIQEAFEHPTKSAWETVYLPRLKAVNIREFAEETGIAESLLHRYRNGTTKPGLRQLKVLVATLRS